LCALPASDERTGARATHGAFVPLAADIGVAAAVCPEVSPAKRQLVGGEPVTTLDQDGQTAVCGPAAGLRLVIVAERDLWRRVLGVEHGEHEPGDHRREDDCHTDHRNDSGDRTHRIVVEEEQLQFHNNYLTAVRRTPLPSPRAVIRLPAALGRVAGVDGHHSRRVPHQESPLTTPESLQIRVPLLTVTVATRQENRLLISPQVA
jgi:hypothetical protein